MKQVVVNPHREYYSSVKEQTFVCLTHVAALTDLEGIMLSGKSQSQKATFSNDEIIEKENQ